ncbi:hypothetical protein HN713_00190, partial [bacterium]|nr:hypothetical protein [bacterium]
MIALGLLFVPMGMASAAAYTHSPSTITAKIIGGKLTISDFNTIRTTLDNVFYIAREKLRSLLLRWKAYNAGGIKNAFHVKNRTKKPHGVPDRVSFVL